MLAIDMQEFFIFCPSVRIFPQFVGGLDKKDRNSGLVLPPSKHPNCPSKKQNQQLITDNQQLITDN